MMNRRFRFPALVALALVCDVVAAAAQQPAPSFEVISVKEAGESRVPVHWEGARFSTAGVPLQTLLAAAYGVSLADLTGLPDWARTARWEISALASRAPSSAEQPILLRTLLAQRFGVVAREVTEERPVYTLSVAGQAWQPSTGLKRSALDCAGRNEAAAIAAYNQGLCTSALSPATGVYSTKGAAIASLTSALRSILQRPVLDRTGLTDLFDIDLHFRPMAPSSGGSDTDTLPDVVTAVREQLGLTLEPTRAPVTTTVFDRVERPTPN